MPRFLETKGEKPNEWMVLDTKSIPFRVLCTCRGYEAPLNAKFLVEALNSYHAQLYSKFLTINSTDVKVDLC
jgi:hypothetical protein